MFSRLTPRQRLGRQGERLARRFLQGLGYRIVAVNVEVSLTTGIGEIDIIAYDGPILAFVEVKTRRREGMFPIERSVTAHKRRLMIRTAARYRSAVGTRGEPYRFDVVTVVLPRSEPPLVRLTRGFFVARGGARLRESDI